jgi:hypothetical protein
MATKVKEIILITNNMGSTLSGLERGGRSVTPGYTGGYRDYAPDGACMSCDDYRSLPFTGLYAPINSVFSLLSKHNLLLYRGLMKYFLKIA